MNDLLTEYRDFVLDTKKGYRVEGMKLVYPLLGIVGEYAELTQKIKSQAPCLPEEIVKEAGDVMWYVVAFCIDAGISSHIVITDGTHIASPSEDLMIDFFGYLSEAVKKYLRDGKSLDVDTVYSYLTFIVARVVYLAHKFAGADRNTILLTNMEKLRSRKARNVIHGDGDNR